MSSQAQIESTTNVVNDNHNAMTDELSVTTTTKSSINHNDTYTANNNNNNLKQHLPDPELYSFNVHDDPLYKATKALEVLANQTFHKKLSAPGPKPNKLTGIKPDKIYDSNSPQIIADQLWRPVLTSLIYNWSKANITQEFRDCLKKYYIQKSLDILHTDAAPTISASVKCEPLTKEELNIMLATGKVNRKEIQKELTTRPDYFKKPLFPVGTPPSRDGRYLVAAARAINERGQPLGPLPDRARLRVERLHPKVLERIKKYPVYSELWRMSNWVDMKALEDSKFLDKHFEQIQKQSAVARKVLANFQQTILVHHNIDFFRLAVDTVRHLTLKKVDLTIVKLRNEYQQRTMQQAGQPRSMNHNPNLGNNNLLVNNNPFGPPAATFGPPPSSFGGFNNNGFAPDPFGPQSLGGDPFGLPPTNNFATNNFGPPTNNNAFGPPTNNNAFGPPTNNTFGPPNAFGPGNGLPPPHHVNNFPNHNIAQPNHLLPPSHHHQPFSANSQPQQITKQTNSTNPAKDQWFSQFANINQLNMWLQAYKQSFNDQFNICTVFVTELERHYKMMFTSQQGPPPIPQQIRQNPTNTIPPPPGQSQATTTTTNVPTNPTTTRIITQTNNTNTIPQDPKLLPSTHKIPPKTQNEMYKMISAFFLVLTQAITGTVTYLPPGFEEYNKQEILEYIQSQMTNPENDTLAAIPKYIEDMETWENTNQKQPYGQSLLPPHSSHMIFNAGTSSKPTTATANTNTQDNKAPTSINTMTPGQQRIGNTPHQGGIDMKILDPQYPEKKIKLEKAQLHFFLHDFITLLQFYQPYYDIYTICDGSKRPISLSDLGVKLQNNNNNNNNNDDDDDGDGDGNSEVEDQEEKDKEQRILLLDRILTIESGWREILTTLRLSNAPMPSEEDRQAYFIQEYKKLNELYSKLDQYQQHLKQFQQWHLGTDQPIAQLYHTTFAKDTLLSYSNNINKNMITNRNQNIVNNNNTNNNNNNTNNTNLPQMRKEEHSAYWMAQQMKIKQQHDNIIFARREAERIAQERAQRAIREAQEKAQREAKEAEEARLVAEQQRQKQLELELEQQQKQLELEQQQQQQQAEERALHEAESKQEQQQEEEKQQQQEQQQQQQQPQAESMTDDVNQNMIDPNAVQYSTGFTTMPYQMEYDNSMDYADDADLDNEQVW